MTTFAFWFFSILAVVAALLVITRRSPVASALWLIVTLFNVAALFVLMDAHFLGAVQVLVYAGAIMVLFLFVIMLLNLGERTPGDTGGWRPRKLVGGLVGAALLAELYVLHRAVPPDPIRLPAGASAQAVEAHGAIQSLSIPLFQAYLVPFEITSLLLLAAIVGAVVLAKRRL